MYNIDSFTLDGVRYEVGDTVGYEQLGWSSDWNGYEVGWDDIDVVGLYSFLGTDVWIHLNTEDNTILEMWIEQNEVGEEE